MNDPLGLFDEEKQNDPLGLFEEDVPLSKKLKSGVNQTWENLKSTFDVGISMPAAGLAGLFGDTAGQEDIFKKMNERVAARKKEAEGPDPGFLGRLAGVAVTLPAQIAAMPFSPAETAKQFVDQGESLRRAYAAQGIDTLGNIAGLALPASLPGKLGARVATGGGINATQDTLTRLGIAGTAQNQVTKDMFAPSWETAALSGVVGGGAGALLGKQKQKQLTPTKDMSAIVSEFKTGKPVEAVDPATKAIEAFLADTRLESPIAAENRIKALNMKERGADDWNSMEHAARAVQEEIDATTQAQKQAAQEADALEQQRTHEFLRDAQQTVIDDHPYGDPGAQFGSTLEHGRIDENGIPIRADLSMEAQNLQNPLQRNLWGDELDQPTGDNGIPITAALDRMPPGPERDAAISQLSGQRRIGRFGQGGAVDPRVFEDLYKFGKSVVRAASGLLMPVYHGTTKEINGLFKTVKGFKDYRNSQPRIEDGWIIPADRAYPGDLGTWFSSTPQGTDTFAGARTGVPGGNVHQAYLNLTKPKVFETHGDFIDWFHEKAADGRSANSIRRSLIKEGYDGIQIKDSMTDAGGARQDFVAFHPQQIESAISPTGMSNRSQRGGIDPDLLTLGIPKLYSSIRSRFTGDRPPQPDTIKSPRSPENIAAKQQMAAKANAVGLTNSVYSSINTLEEVKSLPGKDIGFRIGEKDYTPGQQFGAGVEGALRRNTQNKLLQWVSTLRTRAEANTNAALKQYITGEGGFNKTFQKLTQQEVVDAQALALAMEKSKQDYTPELGKAAGLSPAADAFMQARQRMYDGEYDLGAKVDSELGIEHFDRHPGVARSSFNNAYKAIVGHWEGEGKDRRFVPYTILGANNRWEFNQAKKWWAEESKKKKNLTNLEVIQLDRVGLKKQTSPVRPLDGLAQIFSELAKNNPDFAEAKAAVDEYIKGNTKKMGRYDYHSLKKMGIEGAIGRKGWRTDEQNARDFFKAEVESLDEGFKYWNYQKVVNGMAMAAADPEITAKYPNTVDYLNKVNSNISGQGINQFGAFTNAILDSAFAATGFGSAQAPRKVMSDLRKAASILMMGGFNNGFVGAQLIQYWQAGIPEALRISKDFDINMAKATAKSMSYMLTNRWWMEIAHKTGNLDKAPFPKEVKEAFVWAKKHGLTDFNEMALSHEAAVNPKAQLAEDLLSTPMTIPERMTRPTMFLWFTDLMRGKLQGEELYEAAKRATDYAMTNYHKDEAPLIYQRSGVMGENIGGLKRFIHNNIDQMVSRSMELKKYPEAFAATVGMTLMVQGITGFLAYDVADELSLALTDKPLRHWLEQVVSSQGLLDGYLSTITGLDWNSRMSLAGVVPTDNKGVVSTVVGPHAMKIYSLGEAAVKYGRNPDVQSFNDLARQMIPSGMYGYYEDANLTDDEGFVLNKEGERKYTEPRTEEERDTRKHLGIRPLRERLEDEDLYAAKRVQSKMTDKQAKARSRMLSALNLNKPDDFDTALNDYLDAEGSIENIQGLMQRNSENKNKSERERVISVPSGSSGSIQKYERFWDK